MAHRMATAENLHWSVRPLLKLAGLVGILFLGVLTMRFLCLPIALAYVCLFLNPPSRSNSAWLLGVFLLFVAGAFQPIDVVGRGIHHNPTHSGLRLVPIRSGLILGTPKDECFHSGCLRMPFEPKWVLTWD